MVTSPMMSRDPERSSRDPQLRLKLNISQTAGDAI